MLITATLTLAAVLIKLHELARCCHIILNIRVSYYALIELIFYTRTYVITKKKERESREMMHVCSSRLVVQ